MPTLPADGNMARAAPLRARIAHRLALHTRIAPATLASATPLVSFTFDDAPESACTSGAALLEHFGARGTFYIAGGLIGMQALFWRMADGERIAALHAAGHEIGCHTQSHVLLPELTAEAIAAEAHRNQESLGRIVPGLVLRNFAYPFGYSSIRAKRTLKRLYDSSRSIAPGLNHGRLDRQLLRANPLIEGRLDRERLDRMMDAALARKGWLIFYGHDVAAEPSPYGCTPRLLEAALRAAATRRIPCVTIAQGLNSVR